MRRSRSSETVRVGLLAVPQTAPAVLYSLLEVLSLVGTAWEGLTGKSAGKVRMEVSVVAQRGAPVTCALGVPIMPHASFSDMRGYDVVIAPDILFEPRDEGEPSAVDREAPHSLPAEVHLESLTCPSCAAELDPPPPGATTVRCPYCGHESMLVRSPR